METILSNVNTLILVGIAFVALIAVGLIFSRLYRRSSKERSFVRTGLGGQGGRNGFKEALGGMPCVGRPPGPIHEEAGPSAMGKEEGGLSFGRIGHGWRLSRHADAQV